MKKVYLTLDYELYMSSDVGTVDNCLLRPMDVLTNVLNKYNIKCNVFVDAAYLLRCFQLRDSDSQIFEDYLKVSTHICKLSEAGHSIQLHFHPQWLYSKYIDKKWRMDFNHYKISDMTIDDVLKYLPQAIELLQKYSKNKIVAFRAGGYSFTNNNVFLDILRRYDIHIDTSALRDAKVESKYQTYNYTELPVYSPYCFDNNICIDNINGYFTEYPISTIKMIGYKYWLLKRISNKRYKELTGRDCFGDGFGIGIPGGKFVHIFNQFKRLITNSIIPATIDGMLSLYLENVYLNNSQSNNVFVIIGHPKNLSEKSINIFENFILNHKDLEFSVF